MSNDLVQQMIKSTGKDVAVFQKFMLEYNDYDNTLFYFVEGEDFCYYNPRIKNYSNSMNYINYRCDGKHNVIGVNNLIKEKLTIENNNKLMFFVDRDYGLDDIPKDIYVTDFYSIENFYLNELTVKNILENFIEINKHTNNYKLCLEYFKKTYVEYSKFAVKINIFYYTVREYEKINGCPRTDFRTIKFSKFIENNSIDNFSMLDLSYEELLKLYNIEYSIEEIHFKKNALLFNENDHYNFRGKFELEYLKWFLSSIRISIKDGLYNFDKDLVCKYDFHVDVMKILSEYAFTPQSLIEYVINNVQDILLELQTP